METYYQWHEENVHINVLVIPRASMDEVVGVHDDHLKIRITAAPNNNEANEHLRNFLAKYYGVPKNNVSIIYGETASRKVVCIKNPKQNRPD